ncbi:hypothetical protein MMC06_006486 [Schaereria dolodes]|nr:hypothetical protein [Schaereria dolodes]
MDEVSTAVTDAQMAASNLHNVASTSNTSNDIHQSIPSSQTPSKPVEMIDFSTQIPSQSTSDANPSSSTNRLKSDGSHEKSRLNFDPSTPLSGSDLQPPEVSSSPLADGPSSPKSVLPTPLKRELTGPAIGPSSDKPTTIQKESDEAGPMLVITLLLNTGARHPYKIDEKYLKKRNVNVTGNNPVNMSVYTLKELIWREWRDEWETRPSSPSSIRLIHFGKMLDDKAHLKDGKFVCGDTPHVVHMTVKPQEIVDEEDARIAKGGGRDRDRSESNPGCRCVML